MQIKTQLKDSDVLQLTRSDTLGASSQVKLDGVAVQSGGSTWQLSPGGVVQMKLKDSDVLQLTLDGFDPFEKQLQIGVMSKLNLKDSDVLQLTLTGNGVLQLGLKDSDVLQFNW